MLEKYADRYFKIEDQIKKQDGRDIEVVTCSKFRDTNGNLSKTTVPLPVSAITKDLIIIDDICDGGRTFINIAEAINVTRSLSSIHDKSEYGKIYLIVTHGIFSAGFETLSQHFDGVFCTNSVKDLAGGEWVTRLDFDEGRKNIFYEVKQLNVF